MKGVEPTATRYARTDDGVHIAYQVLGDGPIDFVYAAPWVTHIENRWELPEYASYLRKIASFTRLILFDRRGLGMSDPVPPDRLPDLDTRMTDLRGVMDEVGSERAVVYGASESASLALLFGATHPERTQAIIVHGGFPSGMWAPDAPWGWREDYWRERVDMIERAWGTEEFIRWDFPQWTDERVIRWLASYTRMGASPGAALVWERMDYETDVRDVLPAIHVPTLILHREEDAPEANQYLADHIANARYVALPGREHVPYIGDQDSVLREIEAFVRSIRDVEAELDRVLATIVFTDIVDSTAQAAASGDVRWTEIRQQHDAIVRSHIARFRGREIKTLGDGFLATFDGPARGVRCAEAIAAAVKSLGVDVRAGVHTGEVSLEGDDVAGLAVSIAARVSAKAGPGQVFVSQTVKDLVSGSGLAFEDVGEHELKGIPDPWRLYRVAE